MRKYISITVLVFVLFAALIVQPGFTAPPPILNPMELIEATTRGSSPESVDPAWAHDTASGELLQNVYDTLVVFNGEHVDQYLPSIATNWISLPINEDGSEGQHWNFRYMFQIRTGVQFADPLSGPNYTLTPQDVEYSFQRAMVQDRAGGPQWMFYEPLLNNSRGAVSVAADFGYNLTVGASNYEEAVMFVGRLIDHSIESNSTHLWFNLMFPGSYAPFMQILCQPSSSILSKQWINTYVIETLNRTDWSGSWGNYTEWISHHCPDISPLDDPAPVMYGSGPYILQALDFVSHYWLLSRNTGYWRGWPADYPKIGASQPNGYVDTVRCTWAYDWPTREAMFLSGTVDFCDVPRRYISGVYGQPGIRSFYPLPQLAVDAAFFNFDINPESNPYGPIFSYGVFDESGIPRDFFGYADVRKAFAQLFDYGAFLSTAYLGEAMQPATAIVPGLPYYDANISRYTYNPTAAVALLEGVAGGQLWSEGFNLTILYETDDDAGQIAASMLEVAIEGISSKFHVTTVETIHPLSVASTTETTATSSIRPYGPLIMDRNKQQAGCSPLLYYPDANSAVFTFYGSRGFFSHGLGYSNPAMDALIDVGIRTPDGPDRAAIYSDIQQLAIDDCPSFTLASSIGRFFERDWVCDWYYNIVRQSNRFYNLWKWYYIPHAEYDYTPPWPICNNLPYDINYDGKVNMLDIGSAASGFGASYGPPQSIKWNFRCDVNNDRKINMQDIALVAKNFGKTSVPWHPLV